MSRYDGRPMLRLIELYVLWSIGEVTPIEREFLDEIEPELRHEYPESDSWYSAIAIAMDLPNDAPVKIKNMWIESLSAAKKNGRTLAPQQFAEAFANRLIE